VAGVAIALPRVITALTAYLIMLRSGFKRTTTWSLSRTALSITAGSESPSWTSHRPRRTSTRLYHPS